MKLSSKKKIPVLDTHYSKTEEPYYPLKKNRFFSNMKLRIISAILFILSAVFGAFSRTTVKEITHGYETSNSFNNTSVISRVRIIEPTLVPYTNTVTYASYSWELLSIAVLLLSTAVALLIVSFKKR